MNNDNFLKWSDIRKENMSEDEIIKSDVFCKIIGTLIVRRKELKISQAELAEKANITQANLSRIESGDAVPEIDTVYKIATALNMDIVLIPKF